jgi:hypothetical protein
MRAAISATIAFDSVATSNLAALKASKNTLAKQREIEQDAEKEAVERAVSIVVLKI